jgi:hypothetical protein
VRKHSAATVEHRPIEVALLSLEYVRQGLSVELDVALIREDA